MSTTIDWKNIGFAYRDTGCFIKTACIGGHWGSVETCIDPTIPLHVAATCIHYGQACFEGLKAFTRKDGTIAVFRPQDNAQRMIDTARRLLMEPPSVELFMEAVNGAIKKNLDYVPPYGTGASLYIRPLLIGTSPHVGLHPSEDYALYVLVMPVGPYYKDGFVPIKGIIQEDYDRAAPKGVGNVKVAGNYAAGMRGDFEAKAKGYAISLYLDSATRTYLDEFSTSNFLGITADKRYVTPKSGSILPSITNKSLMQLAEDMGFTIENRPVRVDELSTFVEVGACGTAAVITPIHSITYGEKVFSYGDPYTAGETLTKLYKNLQAIQYGEATDRHQWMAPLQ
jgi:branched-chain amino acid aminotransferase